jgi:hypothetical protein
MPFASPQVGHHRPIAPSVDALLEQRATSPGEVEALSVEQQPQLPAL